MITSIYSSLTIVNSQIKYDQLEKELQEAHEHIQQLTAERDECHKAAQIAMTKVEAKGKELQVERECSRQLKENCLRDVSAAESRAIAAEVYVCVFSFISWPSSLSLCFVLVELSK